MAQTSRLLYTAARRGLVAAIALVLAACVYQPDVQQGNALDPEPVEQVEIGMSKSAVQFLLGTPTIMDPFHAERWDYPYYYRIGRSPDVRRRWIVIWFEDDRVVRIERDRLLEPTS